MRYKSVFQLQAGRANEMPAILIISEDFPPRVMGGVGSHVYDLATGLVQSGWSVTVLTHGLVPSAQVRFEEGVRVCRMRFYSGLSEDGTRSFRTSTVIEQCQQLASYGGFDLLHFHDPMYIPAAKLLKETFRATAIFTQHIVFRDLLSQVTHGNKRIAQFYPHLSQEVEAETQVMESADAIICVSEHLKRTLTQIYSSWPPLWVVPHGVDIGRFSEVDDIRVAELRSHLAAPSEKIVLFVGQGNRNKGIPELLTAASLVIGQMPRAKFVFIISGLNQSQIEALRQNLSFEGRVLFFSEIERAVIPLYFAAADIVVMPSRSEAFGLVALEAMAASKPLIVSEIDPLKELVIDGINGRVVPFLECDKKVVNVKCLAAAILELVKLPVNTLKQMGECGFQIARQKYSKELMVERTISVYCNYITGSCEQKVKGFSKAYDKSRG